MFKDFLDAMKRKLRGVSEERPLPQPAAATAIIAADHSARYQHQPSTSTKKMILKGREIVTGGSIITPIDINTANKVDDQKG